MFMDDEGSTEFKIKRGQERYPWYRSRLSYQVSLIQDYQ